MLKRIIFCISLLCSTLQAQAAEYDIVLLAPEGQELLTKSVWKENGIVLNESGYVGGSFQFIPKKFDSKKAYVYHQEIGLKIIPFPNGGNVGRVEAINNHGIVVGVYNINTSLGDPYFLGSEDRIFVYNVTTERCYDLIEEFGLEDEISPGHLPIKILGVTDDNKIIFKHVRDDVYINKSRFFIFDLISKTASMLPLEGILSINQKGQMIGMRNIGYADSSPKTAWFYDPETGQEEIGSLDIFNRWKVSPIALSSNGTVAGFGFDSYFEKKGFTWRKDLGFQQFDIDDHLHSIIVNDEGHAVGYSNHFHSAILFTPENGTNYFEGIPYGINNQTQVVGSYETFEQGYDVGNAFIWDFSNEMRKLSSLIPKKTGWSRLEKATHINNEGFIIGFGKYDGIEHHFLLIPRNQK